MDVESIKAGIAGKQIKDFKLDERVATIDDLYSVIDELDGASAESAALSAKTAMEKAEYAADAAAGASTQADAAMVKSSDAMARANEAFDAAADAELKSNEADRIHDSRITDLGNQIRGLSDALSGLQLTDVQALSQMKDVISQIITAFGGKVRRTTMVSFDAKAGDETALEVPVRADGSRPADVVWG